MAKPLERPRYVTPGELAAGTPLSVMADALVVGTKICAVVFGGTTVSKLKMPPVFVHALETRP